MRKHIERINKAIEIIFYALFITVPLAMHPKTNELFEFNKMWLVFIYSLLIFFLWGAKMIIQKRFEVRRTPFDIPLLLFLLSQIISTVISLDPHTSFWGYYSRFNGGLLSTISYIFLYYAFATNILASEKEESLKKTYKMLFATVVSAVLVSLWGLPSHFGYDPTCLVFRGSFDVACWTEAFQPKIRMFSTLGQPNWLATFLAILIPITVAFSVNEFRKLKKLELNRTLLLTIFYCLLSILFYLDMGWSLSQSGFIGFWAGNIVFCFLFTILILKRNSFSIAKTVKQKAFIALVGIQIIFLITTFLTVNPIPQLRKFSLVGITNQLSQSKKETVNNSQKNPIPTPPPSQPAQPALEAGITGSGVIRKIVWKGAIEIFKANPIFGTGVETYAFAYYKYRPLEHNLTSEWDYLYNKAHNEFLNYLATTGTFGFGTYIFFIGAFIFFALKHMFFQFKKGIMGNPVLPALVGAFVGIQVSNFFGFSVVIVNLFMFFIPLFYWSTTNPNAKFFVLPKNSKEDFVPSTISAGQIMAMIVVAIVSIYSIFFLSNYWNADINYALGYNYQQINEFSQANPYLEKAVSMRGGEDLYKNELSVNLAALSIGFAQQKDVTSTTQYATRAKELSDSVSQRNPNNVVYWKTRTRVMFSLAQLNPIFINDAIAAIEKAHQLAPSDAKITYNQALIYDQSGQKDKAMASINETIKLKPNYRDAYYAKALFLSGMIEKEEKNSPKISEYKKEAIDALNFILKNILPNDEQTINLLKTLQ